MTKHFCVVLGMFPRRPTLASREVPSPIHIRKLNNSEHRFKCSEFRITWSVILSDPKLFSTRPLHLKGKTVKRLLKLQLESDGNNHIFQLYDEQ